MDTRRVSLAACIALLLTSTLHATDFGWQGPNLDEGDGAFDSPNWFDGQFAHKGPPGPGDNASIGSSATITISGGGVKNLMASTATLVVSGNFSITNAGTLHFTGGGNVSIQNEGALGNDSANLLRVEGPTVTVTNATLLSFNVSAGGKLTYQTGGPGNSGIVSGAGSVVNINGKVTDLNGGAKDGGTLNVSDITNEAHAGFSSSGADALVAATGTATMNGGAVSVSDGGKMTIGGGLLLYADPMNIRGGAGVGASGAGSAVSVSDRVELLPGPSAPANPFVGAITLSDHATFHAQQLFVDGSSSRAAALRLSAGATMLIDSAFSLGQVGKATLDISEGAGLTATGAGSSVAIGFASGAEATVTVDGASSYLNFGAAAVSLAKDAGSKATVGLTGGATMQVGGSGSMVKFAVGDSGLAALNLSGGSAFHAIGAAYLVEIGSAANGNGVVSVGDGSTFATEGSLALANLGSGNFYVGGATATVGGDFFMGFSTAAEGAQTPVGLLNVSGGAHFTAGSTVKNRAGIGQGAGTIATMKINGAGTVADFNAATIAGVFGSGSISVDTGAAANFPALGLGGEAGSHGSLVVYGSTSVASTKVLVVGGSAVGSGFVTAQDEGLVRVTQKMFITSGGSVLIGPGLQPPPPIDPNDPATPFPTGIPGGRIFVGTDNFGPDNTVRVGHGGVLSGKGTQIGTSVLTTNVDGNVIIGEGGKFQPGADPDVFNIHGDCDLSDGGKGGGETDFQIGGAGTAGVDYDQLVVSGTVTMGGTLKLVPLPGYVPKVGDSFTLIKAGAMAGQFAAIDAPGLTIGTASGPGGVTFMVTAVNAIAAPVITSLPSATASLGSPFSYQITATNSPAGYAATGLAPGLDVDPATGLISGTPTAEGVYPIAISATNVGGTGAGTLTLTVGAAPVPGAPVINSAPAASGQIGAAFSYQIAATNGPTSFAASGLPDGLVLDPATGIVSGTPTTAGAFTVTFTATNAIGSGTATVVLTIDPPALPIVTVTSKKTEVHVGQSDALTFTISQAPTVKTKIRYVVKGSAVNGEDYVFLSGKAKLKPGETKVKVQLTPRGDLGGAESKKVKLELVPDPAYTIGTTETLKIKLLNP